MVTTHELASGEANCFLNWLSSPWGNPAPNRFSLPGRGTGLPGGQYWAPVTVPQGFRKGSQPQPLVGAERACSGGSWGRRGRGLERRVGSYSRHTLRSVPHPPPQHIPGPAHP